MKFSQKIFIMTFILIIISINMIGFLVIRNNHRVNIDSEISRGIAQINQINYNMHSRRKFGSDVFIFKCALKK